MKNGTDGWIGVDLDGTLALYDRWEGPGHIGEPIPAMVERVREWLALGFDVRIFTARISHDGSVQRMHEAAIGLLAINAWSLAQFDRHLPVTNLKDFAMIELWDDRCVQVETNKGTVMGASRIASVVG